MFYGKAKELMNKLNLKYQIWLNPNLDNVRDWQENFIKLLELEYNDKDCYMCKHKVPEEGIVLRKENLLEYEAFKLKSHKFLERESNEAEKGIENIEDSQILV